MVSVSQEALNLVKSALVNFNADITGMSQRSNNKAEDIMSECQGQVHQTAGIIAEIERKIEQLTNQIEYLESEIVRDINEVNKIADQISQLQQNIQRLEEHIVGLRSQISSLRVQLADCDDDDVRQQIQSKSQDKD